MMSQLVFFIDKTKWSSILYLSMIRVDLLFISISIKDQKFFFGDDGWYCGGPSLKYNCLSSFKSDLAFTQ